MDRQFLWIYNYIQAEWFIKQGLPLVKIGRGSKGDIYHKFLRDENAERVFIEWKTQKHRFEEDDLNDKEDRCDNTCV